MNDIVLRLVQEYTENISEYIKKYGITDIGELASKLKGMSDEHVRKLLTALIEESDEALWEAKRERKKDGYVVHERRVPRTVQTMLGDITYRRTYYRSRETGEMSYLLDHVIGTERYTRVCADVSAKLVNRCAEASFGRSADIVTGGRVSRQTVKNKLMRTGELAHMPLRAKETPKELHVFADEDHVHMQNGKSGIVPIVTVSEGVRPVCKGRNMLVGKFHVQGYKIPPDELWEYVYALCAEKYDMGKVERVYLHGDGAKWITSGLSYLPGAVRVLDHYHLRSRMRTLTAGSGKEMSMKLWGHMRNGNEKGFGDAVYELLDETKATYPKGIVKKRLKKIRKTGAYLLNNWDAVMKRLEPGMVGSCTEPLVSHVLSERLSRNPMGWSEAGLSKMAMVRVYTQNGDTVRGEDIAGDNIYTKKVAPKRIERYEDIVNRQRKTSYEMSRGFGEKS
jgi:hypothetical protein